MAEGKCNQWDVELKTTVAELCEVLGLVVAVLGSLALQLESVDDESLMR